MIKWSECQNPCSWDQTAVAMPDEIATLDIINDRLYVTLVDGRTIDMTDWFSAVGNAN